MLLVFPSMYVRDGKSRLNYGCDKKKIGVAFVIQE